MNITIRPMEQRDREAVKDMMRSFYSSPAVYTDGSEEIFERDIENCLNDCPFLEGYVFESTGVLLGYAMAAKSFSTEFGLPCIWIEDLYIQEKYRGLGLGSRFLKLIEEKYPDCIYRLEVEEENRRAVAVYKKQGYGILPYMQMKK